MRAKPVRRESGGSVLDLERDIAAMVVVDSVLDGIVGRGGTDRAGGGGGTC